MVTVKSSENVISNYPRLRMRQIGTNPWPGSRRRMVKAMPSA